MIIARHTIAEAGSYQIGALVTTDVAAPADCKLTLRIDGYDVFRCAIAVVGEAQHTIPSLTFLKVRTGAVVKLAIEPSVRASATLSVEPVDASDSAAMAQRHRQLAADLQVFVARTMTDRARMRAARAN